MFGRKSATPGTVKQQQAETPPVQTAALNGSAQAAMAGEIIPEEAKKRSVAGKQIAAAFGELVTLLMRSPADKHHSLSDLEWLVIPALAHRQYALAEAQSKETGAISPVGGVLWALVCEEVDKRLSDLSAPVRLKPNEWRSGDIPWIVLATGDKRILAGLIEQLTKTVFKDRSPKLRARGADGKVSVGHIEVKQKDAAA
jgi:hemolysin-activating ACP:hemolysin acyltransferase